MTIIILVLYIPISVSPGECFPEYLPNRFEIAVAVQIIRLEIAGFGPLIPRVDRDKRCALGMSIQIFLRHLHAFFDILGRVVFDNAPRNRRKRGLLSHPHEMCGK